MISERRLVIGLITSTEFLEKARYFVDPNLFESKVAKLLAGWCLDYYDKYNKAPGIHIGDIFYEKLKKNKIHNSNIAKEIEEDILPSLNDEYEEEGINIDYLFPKTIEYFNDRRLDQLVKEIKDFREKGDTESAEKLITSYQPPKEDDQSEIDLSDESSLKIISSAFSERRKPLITYPGAFGEFINSHLIRGGFVAFMGRPKGAKTATMIDLAIRGARQKRKVGFIQGGDLTEDQLIRRICIYLTEKSDNPKYIGKFYTPVRDCIRNQLDTCDHPDRESDFGIFDRKDEDFIRHKVKLGDLINMAKEFPDYSPCHNCSEYTEKHKKLGATWIEQTRIPSILTGNEATKKIKDFFIKYKRRFKISSHANKTLSPRKIKNILQNWKKEGFEPDILIVDFADLMIADRQMEYRHEQDQIWSNLRGISKDHDLLLVTGTWSDSKSLSQDRLNLSNFSEDVRKYGHVTAMWGLNWDVSGREKELGIMCVNDLVSREGDGNPSNEVYVLQSLRQGRVFLGSFW